MKKNILYFLLEIIFLIIFNLLFFFFGSTDHSYSVWISYGFIHFSYIMLIITNLMIRKSSRSDILGLSLYGVSLYYFIIELIIGLVFIFIDNKTIVAPLTTQSILAAIYLVILITHLLANEYTADSIQTHEKNLLFIKTSSNALKKYMSEVSDASINKHIEKAYDIVHSSPVKSSEKVYLIEQEISDNLESMENIIKRGDGERIKAIILKIVKLVEERNRILKLNN